MNRSRAAIVPLLILVGIVLLIIVIIFGLIFLWILATSPALQIGLVMVFAIFLFVMLQQFMRQRQE